MYVGRFPSHGVQQLQFGAFFRKGSQFDARTVGGRTHGRSSGPAAAQRDPGSVRRDRRSPDRRFPLRCRRRAPRAYCWAQALLLRVQSFPSSHSVIATKRGWPRLPQTGDAVGYPIGHAGHRQDMFENRLGAFRKRVAHVRQSVQFLPIRYRIAQTPCAISRSQRWFSASTYARPPVLSPSCNLPEWRRKHPRNSGKDDCLQWQAARWWPAVPGRWCKACGRLHQSR